MPKYAWRGINLQGADCRGAIYAHSRRQLEGELFKQDIALLSDSVAVPWSFLRKPSQHTIISFFDSLATLLEAGLFLPTALELLRDRMQHVGFKALIEDVYYALHDGVSFSEALAAYDLLFGQCALELIASGEQIGDLPRGLRLAVNYYTSRDEFEERIKGVILLPVITFCFFLVVACVILVYIVPVFASLFLAAGKDMPWITHVLLQASAWCSSSSSIITLAISIVLFCALKKYLNRPQAKKLTDTCILYIPVFGAVIFRQSVYQFLQTTALMLGGGIHEVPALHAACAGLNNEYVRSALYTVIKRIEGGHTIADSLEYAQLHMSPEVHAMLAVGEESGTLAQAMEHGARFYKKEIEKSLQLISSLVQPCLILLLGIFITILIFAVYMPVLQLSYVIT